jgi:hypothetical protein
LFYNGIFSFKHVVHLRSLGWAVTMSASKGGAPQFPWLSSEPNTPEPDLHASRASMSCGHAYCVGAPVWLIQRQPHQNNLPFHVLQTVIPLRYVPRYWTTTIC